MRRRLSSRAEARAGPASRAGGSGCRGRGSGRERTEGLLVRRAVVGRGVAGDQVGAVEERPARQLVADEAMAELEGRGHGRRFGRREAEGSEVASIEAEEAGEAAELLQEIDGLVESRGGGGAVPDQHGQDLGVG